MFIKYDDMYEFTEVVTRCSNTVKKGMCHYCPFYDRCEICDVESRHIQFGCIAEFKERVMANENRNCTKN